MGRDVLIILGKGLKCTYSSNGDWGLTFPLVSSSPFLSPPPPTLIYPWAWKTVPNLIWRLAHSTDRKTFISVIVWQMQVNDYSPRHSFQRRFSWVFTLGTTFIHHPLTCSLIQYFKKYIWVPMTRQAPGKVLEAWAWSSCWLWFSLLFSWHAQGMALERKSLGNGRGEGHKYILAENFWLFSPVFLSPKLLKMKPVTPLAPTTVYWKRVKLPKSPSSHSWTPLFWQMII